MRVLVREQIADAGLALLQSRFEVDVDESSPLEDVIGNYDAIVIRSATKLSADLIEKGTRLRISGNRPDGCRAPKCNFLAMEIEYGPFESVLEVPPGYDLSQAKAAYLNGFLRIDVPMAQRPAKSTKVPIAEGN